LRQGAANARAEWTAREARVSCLAPSVVNAGSGTRGERSAASRTTASAMRAGHGRVPHVFHRTGESRTACHRPFADRF
jgi:hypothetical protein